MKIADPEYRSLTEREREEASNAYVMTLMTVWIGLPFPIVNLIACVAYYLFHRSKSPFVKFHTFQAVVSQLLIIIMNSIGILWSVKVIFYHGDLSNSYLGYVIALVISNIMDYVYNIIAAMRARKGKYYSFIFFGLLSYLIFLNKPNSPVDENKAAL